LLLCKLPIGLKIYQKAVIYISKGHTICFSIQRPCESFPKFWIFGFKIYHLATVPSGRQPSGKSGPPTLDHLVRPSRNVLRTGTDSIKLLQPAIYKKSLMLLKLELCWIRMTRGSAPGGVAQWTSHTPHRLKTRVRIPPGIRFLGKIFFKNRPQASKISNPNNNGFSILSFGIVYFRKV
jgi:hypothetical protein